MRGCTSGFREVKDREMQEETGDVKNAKILLKIVEKRTMLF